MRRSRSYPRRARAAPRRDRIFFRLSRGLETGFLIKMSAIYLKIMDIPGFFAQFLSPPFIVFVAIIFRF